MGRSPSCCDKDNGVKRGPWSPEEDKLLIDYVEKYGQGNWKRIAEQSGLNRCGKSCRLRWTNYLRPDIKRGAFSDEEEVAIIKLHEGLGNKWSRIAAHLPGRTDNEIKNFWNTSLRKKLLRLGFDPKTHKPVSDPNLLLSSPNLSNLMNLLDPALILRASVAEMARIQAQLQNLLQAKNSSLIPYFQGISQLKNSILLNGLINGANTQFATNIFQPQAMLADLGNIIPLPKEYPSTATSLRSIEGEISPSLQDNKIRSFTRTHNSNYSLPSLASEAPESSIANQLESFEGEFCKGLADTKMIGFSNKHNSEYSLPSLISVTPESSIVNQFESADQSIIPRQTLDSNVFDPWDNFVDNEASTLSWKDILG